MEIMSIAIAVLPSLVSHWICQHLSKMKSSQELMLLNAEQEAANLRGQAEREADLLVNEAKRESSLLKKKRYWRPKKKPENTDADSNQNVKNSNKSKSFDREATSLDHARTTLK